MTSPRPRPRYLPRVSPLHAIVASAAFAGAGCVVAAWPAVSAHPPLLPIVLIVALAAVTENTPLHLRFASDNWTVTVSEATLLVGLTIAPWPWITFALPIGVLIGHTIARRDFQKIVFNTAATAIGCAITTGIVRLAAGSIHWREAGAPRFDLALVGAALAYFVWNTLTVTLVISVSGGMAARTILREGLGFKFGVLFGNSFLALLLINVPWHGSSVVLIPFCAVLLFITYRGYHRALKEGDIWRQLDAAAKELTRLDAEGVAAAAVARAVTLFDADFAELAIGQDSSARVYRNTRGGDASVRRGQLGHDTDAARSGRTSAAGQPTVVDTALAVPTADTPAVLGVLRMGLSSRSGLEPRHQPVLRTFAHSVAASLQNARLYTELRYQADVSALEAARDPLTGIANRKTLHTEAASALLRAEEAGAMTALLLIDLDHFKEINDTLGHHAGDAVLCTIADRLSIATHGTGMVGRLGGDEFAILLHTVADPVSAEAIARRLLSMLAVPVDYEGMRLAVGGSIGIACYPEDGLTADDLLRRADMAMYQAKQARGAVSRYRSDRDDHSVGRITLAAELGSAIRERQFLMQFQPQIDFVTGRVVGAEALARWRHPARGLLGPVEFMDLVERSGLVREFAMTTLEQAIATAAGWQRSGLDLPVSVNLSARNLLDGGLPHDVSTLLHRFGLPPERLILEITETTMITDAEAVEAVLSQLRRRGVQLSVDDFGTGYSSLAFLQRVAVNEIKIDKSFVIAMTGSDSDTAIVRATIELAHGLGIRVVAEGVETQDHVLALRALGCDVAQGWHYGRPGSPEQLATLARSRESASEHLVA